MVTKKDVQSIAVTFPVNADPYSKALCLAAVFAIQHVDFVNFVQEMNGQGIGLAGRLMPNL